MPEPIIKPLDTLPEVQTFAPLGATAELLDQIYESMKVVNASRDATSGLHPDIVRRIEDEFLVDRVRHSATIEGSTLDRRETLHVLTTGQIIEGKQRPSEEVRNLGNALRKIALLVEEDVIRDIHVRGIHGILLEGLDVNAGRYRPHDVAISGAKYRPPDHLEVPRLMHELLGKLKSPPSDVTGFTVGVYAHWAMARIHPFVDGNGRMARIVQDLLFLRYRLVPAPVSFKDVDEYYAALESADEGEPAPFVELIARATLASLAKYLAAIEDVQRTDDWIEALATSVNQSIHNADHALYLRWSQKMAEVRETFTQIANKLTSKIPALTCTVKRYAELDYQQFREIREQGRSSKTWDFGITFKLGDHLVRFIFWYGKHFPRSGETEPLLQTPVLLVSIDDGGRYELLEDAGQDAIALREIGVAEGEFVQIRYDPVEDRRRYDTPAAVSQICQDFVTQVLRGKLRVG